MIQGQLSTRFGKNLGLDTDIAIEDVVSREDDDAGFVVDDRVNAAARRSCMLVRTYLQAFEEATMR